MYVGQLNTVASALTNVNKVSLHTSDPGNTGENESTYSRQTLSWSSPEGGVIKAMATFTGVVGTFTHVGLWANTTFVQGATFNITLPSSQTLKVLVELAVEVKS